MTKEEFKRIVDESVAAGADRKEAEQYAIRGYKLPTDAKGNPVFTDAEKPKTKSK
jgi:hypothetical protein